MIKEALKEWHAAHSKNLPGRIKSLKERQAELDGKGELEALSTLEIEELHTVSSDIHSLARVNTSIVWQQSRLHWLREGDANSKYFHSILLGRRRQNHLHSIVVDGTIVEGVYPVRQTVFSHFANHFKRRGTEKVALNNLTFNTLSYTEGGGLTRPFTEEEVKAAVWDCDSFKSPGPDGVNFGFLKEFWIDMKQDIMRFMTEFHRNGRLSRGINSTFIALIPKTDNP